MQKYSDSLAQRISGIRVERDYIRSSWAIFFGSRIVHRGSASAHKFLAASIPIFNFEHFWLRLALILSKFQIFRKLGNQNRLHLCKENKNWKKTAKDHPPAPIQQNSTHKVLFGTNRLWHQCLNSSIYAVPPADEGLVTKQVYKHVSKSKSKKSDTSNNFNIFR